MSRFWLRSARGDDENVESPGIRLSAPQVQNLSVARTVQIAYLYLKRPAKIISDILRSDGKLFAYSCVSEDACRLTTFNSVAG